jgi:hypothetical protein
MVNVNSNHFRMGLDMLEPRLCQIFQMFQMYVAKVDLDVAMAIHVCCKCMFQMFRLFSNICCKCFIWMLYMLHWLYTYFCRCMFQIFQLFSNICCKWFIRTLYMLHWLYTYVVSVCFKCFSCFKYMLQVFI